MRVQYHIMNNIEITYANKCSHRCGNNNLTKQTSKTEKWDDEEESMSTKTTISSLELKHASLGSTCTRSDVYSYSNELRTRARAYTAPQTTAGVLHFLTLYWTRNSDAGQQLFCTTTRTSHDALLSRRLQRHLTWAVRLFTLLAGMRAPRRNK